MTKSPVASSQPSPHIHLTGHCCYVSVTTLIITLILVIIEYLWSIIEHSRRIYKFTFHWYKCVITSVYVEQLNNGLLIRKFQGKARLTSCIDFIHKLDVKLKSKVLTDTQTVTRCSGLLLSLRKDRDAAIRTNLTRLLTIIFKRYTLIIDKLKLNWNVEKII